MFSLPPLSVPCGTHPAFSLTDPCLPLATSPPGQVISSSPTSLWLFFALLFHAPANHFHSRILQAIFPPPVSTAPTSLPARGLLLMALRGSHPVRRCRVTKPCGLSICKRGLLLPGFIDSRSFQTNRGARQPCPSSFYYKEDNGSYHLLCLIFTISSPSWELRPSSALDFCV